MTAFVRTGDVRSDQLDASSFSTRKPRKRCCKCGRFCALILFIKEEIVKGAITIPDPLWYVAVAT